MATYHSNQLIVIWVSSSGKLIIPSIGRFLVGFLAWSHSFVGILPSQERKNNGFRLSTTGMYEFSSKYPQLCLILNN